MLSKKQFTIRASLASLVTICFLSAGQIALAQENTNTNSREIKAQEIRAQIEQPTDGFTINPANPNTINPRKFIFEIAPGTTMEDFVYIHNLSDKENTFILYGADPTFSAQGTPAYKTKMDSSLEGEGAWIEFESPQITLGPGENKVLKFSITAPKDAKYGDHRVGITMEKNAKDTQNPNITISTRVILHCDINITDNPKNIEKKFGENEITPLHQKRPWQFWYFWISLILFVISLTALIIATIYEKKCLSKKQPTTKKKTSSSTKKPTHKKR